MFKVAGVPVLVVATSVAELKVAVNIEVLVADLIVKFLNPEISVPAPVVTVPNSVAPDREAEVLV